MAKLILLYFGTIILAYLSQVYYPVKANNTLDRHFMRDKTDIFCWAIIVWMTLFNGLKTSYNDTGNYIMYFRDSATTLTEHLATSTETGFADNPLYYICQMYVKSVIDNYHVWFMIVAFFNAWIVIKFLKHYSENFAMSIMVYQALGTYLMYVAAMKQSIAVGILLIAVPYLLKHKWIKYYFLVILAILFHTHAFLFLVLPLFISKPWGKLTYFCICVVLFAILTYDNTLGAFMRYAQSIGANVAEIEVFDNYTISPLRIAVYLIVPIVTYVFRKRLLINTNETTNLFINWGILSCLILAIGLANGANLFSRMSGYFELGIALTFPWMIQKVFDRSSAYFLNFAATACFLVYMVADLKIAKGFTDGTYISISLYEFFASLFV